MSEVNLKVNLDLSNPASIRAFQSWLNAGRGIGISATDIHVGDTVRLDDSDTWGDRAKGKQARVRKVTNGIYALEVYHIMCPQYCTENMAHHMTLVKRGVRRKGERG